MPIIRLDNLHVAGMIKDTPAHELPPEAFSDTLNVELDDGVVKRVKGMEQTLGVPGTDYTYAPYWFQPYPTTDQYYWIYAAHDGTNWRLFENHAGTVHTELQDATVSVNFNLTDLDIGWNGGVFGGVAVFNNGKDTPYVITDPSTPASGMVELDYVTGTSKWSDIPITATVIRPFKQFLVALDVTDGGTRFPQRVKWSHPANPGEAPSSWDETDPTVDAGEVDLLESLDICIDCLPLRDVNVIYKEQSTWIQQFTPTNDIFLFSQLFKNYGILSRRCVKEFEGKHFVVTLGDVIVHDGQNAERVLDTKLTRWLFNQLGTNFARSFVSPDYANHKMLFVYPTGNSTFPNQMLIWDWDTGAATIRDVDDLTHIAYGNIGGAYPTDSTWDQFDNPELTFAGDTYIHIPGYAMDMSAAGRIEMIVESTDDTIIRDLWSSSQRDDHYEFQASPTQAVLTMNGTSTGNVGGTSDTGDRDLWEFRWTASGTSFDSFKNGTQEVNTTFSVSSAANGFNIGVNQAQSGSFFEGIIQTVEVYDAETGGNMIHRWKINDGVDDGGVIADDVGSPAANGVLTLGSGFWTETLLPITMEAVVVNQVLATYEDTLTDGGTVAADWNIRVPGKHSDARVGASGVSVSTDTVTVTFAAGTFASGDTLLLSYAGTLLSIGVETCSKFAELDVTNSV